MSYFDALHISHFWCFLFKESIFILEELISKLIKDNVILMVKGYWEKRFKKELVEEEDKLKQEVAEAVRKKLDELAESESES